MDLELKLRADRIYAICDGCGNLVYREPGKRHGDGQQDTDDAPVWLLDSSHRGITAKELMAMPLVNCGCTEH
jgi:hypothetical protein